MICPVCKNSHPDWFVAHRLQGCIAFGSRPAFFCKKCGACFVPVSKEDVAFWHELVQKETREYFTRNRAGGNEGAPGDIIYEDWPDEREGGTGG
jgi:hypothetical protein